MRRLVFLAALSLLGALSAGCLGTWWPPGDGQAIPERDGGPYGGNGMIHLVGMYFSFNVTGDGQIAGDMGDHCPWDAWSTGPPSVLLFAPPREQVQTHVVIRELHPGARDFTGVSHFGTEARALAPVLVYDFYHAAMFDINSAFDPYRVLGRVGWNSEGPAFDWEPLPTGAWLTKTFEYEVVQDGELYTIEETIHLRDFGEVPLQLDRTNWLCE